MATETFDRKTGKYSVVVAFATGTGEEVARRIFETDKPYSNITSDLGHQVAKAMIEIEAETGRDVRNAEMV